MIQTKKLGTMALPLLFLVALLSGLCAFTGEGSTTGRSGFLPATEPSPAESLEWAINGTAICAAANAQGNQQIISDGAGGAIITWEDSRSGNKDLYAQRVNSAGSVQWTADGVAISTTGVDQLEPQLVSDGAGGAIITWYQMSMAPNYYDIYAQRVNSAGVIQWNINGVPICAATANQYSPQIVSDGVGGAIITWHDYRSGTNYDIYAQRVSSAGTVQWAANGVAICTASLDQKSPQIVSDGVGGAIMTWQDNKTYLDGDLNTVYYGIPYAQRVDSAGSVKWAANGIGVSTATENQISPQMTSDGASGAIITWDWENTLLSYDVYAQRINATGSRQWGNNGKLIYTTAAVGSHNPQVVSDGTGNAIITWSITLGFSGTDLYAQRVNSAGSIQWVANGIAISTAANSQYNFQLISDGASGAIITWDDNRKGAYDIYAQRVNSAGVAQWAANGTVICAETSDQTFPQIASDGASGAIITWVDARNGNDDIYAQRVKVASSGDPNPDDLIPGFPVAVLLMVASFAVTILARRVRFASCASRD